MLMKAEAQRDRIKPLCACWRVTGYALSIAFGLRVTASTVVRKQMRRSRSDAYW